MIMFELDEIATMPHRIKKLPPVHPGRVLRATLDEIKLSAREASRAMRIPTRNFSAIISARGSITAETALRLSRFFGTSAQVWLNMQRHYDLAVAESKSAHRIAAEVQPYRKSA